MIYDVREENKDITKVLYSNFGSVVGAAKDSTIGIASDSGQTTIVVSKDSIDNLILALQKAKEIWCE